MKSAVPVSLGASAPLSPPFFWTTYMKEITILQELLWLEEPGKIPRASNLWGSSENFWRNILYSHKFMHLLIAFKYTNTHVFPNPGSIILIRKKIISNLKIKQDWTIQNIKFRRNLKIVESHPLILVAIAQNR